MHERRIPRVFSKRLRWTTLGDGAAIYLMLTVPFPDANAAFLLTQFMPRLRRTITITSPSRDLWNEADSQPASPRANQSAQRRHSVRLRLNFSPEQKRFSGTWATWPDWATAAPRRIKWQLVFAKARRDFLTKRFLALTFLFHEF